MNCIDQRSRSGRSKQKILHRPSIKACAAAVVSALPAVVRITAQGLRQVDPAALESARSLGATGRQQLWQVQLPLARRSLLLALNQALAWYLGDADERVGYTYLLRVLGFVLILIAVIDKNLSKA